MTAPHKSEWPAATGHSAEQNTQTAAIVSPQGPEGNDAKRLANLKAGFALRGFEVRECSAGGYFVSRWNLTKFCPANADLESFAIRVGVHG